MAWNRGYALIETLLASAILVSGIVGVASVFTVTTGVSIRNQQRTVATLLLYDKMEQLRSTPIGDAAWMAGGALKPGSPAAGYFDYVTITTDAIVISSTTDTTFPYMRMWQIAGAEPRSLTVIVYVQRAGLTRRRLELIRATTLVSGTF